MFFQTFFNPRFCPQTLSERASRNTRRVPFASQSGCKYRQAFLPRKPFLKIFWGKTHNPQAQTLKPVTWETINIWCQQ
jgi:hypothetical protein